MKPRILKFILRYITTKTPDFIGYVMAKGCFTKSKRRFTKCSFLTRYVVFSFTSYSPQKLNIMKNLKSKNRKLVTVLLSIIPSVTFAQVTPALVDFDAYQNLVAEVKEQKKQNVDCRRIYCNQ